MLLHDFYKKKGFARLYNQYIIHPSPDLSVLYNPKYISLNLLVYLTVVAFNIEYLMLHCIAHHITYYTYIMQHNPPNL